MQDPPPALHCKPLIIFCPQKNPPRRSISLTRKSLQIWEALWSCPGSVEGLVRWLCKFSQGISQTIWEDCITLMWIMLIYVCQRIKCNREGDENHLRSPLVLMIIMWKSRDRWVTVKRSSWLSSSVLGLWLWLSSYSWSQKWSQQSSFQSWPAFVCGSVVTVYSVWERLQKSFSHLPYLALHLLVLHSKVIPPATLGQTHHIILLDLLASHRVVFKHTALNCRRRKMHQLHNCCRFHCTQYFVPKVQSFYHRFCLKIYIFASCTVPSKACFLFVHLFVCLFICLLACSFICVIVRATICQLSARSTEATACHPFFSTWISLSLSSVQLLRPIPTNSIFFFASISFLVWFEMANMSKGIRLFDCGMLGYQSNYIGGCGLAWLILRTSSFYNLPFCNSSMYQKKNMFHAIKMLSNDIQFAIWRNTICYPMKYKCLSKEIQFTIRRNTFDLHCGTRWVGGCFGMQPFEKLMSM